MKWHFHSARTCSLPHYPATFPTQKNLFASPTKAIAQEECSRFCLSFASLGKWNAAFYLSATDVQALQKTSLAFQHTGYV